MIFVCALFGQRRLSPPSEPDRRRQGRDLGLVSMRRWYLNRDVQSGSFDRVSRPVSTVFLLTTFVLAYSTCVFVLCKMLTLSSCHLAVLGNLSAAVG